MNKYGIASSVNSPNAVHLYTFLSSRKICLNRTMKRNKNKTIIIDVAIVSAVTFKNSKGVPTKSAVVKKVSPRNIKINFLFIVVVCSLCRVSLATNVFGLCVRAGFGAQNCQPALNLNRSTKLQVCTSPRLTQNPC